MDATKTGNFIAELRREKELTQRELADALLVSDKAVSRWETGRGMPDIENLEALATTLDTSVAELLLGERMTETVEVAEANEIASGGLELADQLLKKRTRLNVAAGFLIGFIIMLLVAIHLTSPIVLTFKEVNAHVDELTDGTLVVVGTTTIVGWDIDTYSETGEKNDVFVSAYTTRLRQLLGSDAKAVASLGKAIEVASVRYYPGTPDDILLYDTTEPVRDYAGGVVTLPRLIYNMWLTIAIAAGVVCLVVWWFLRKRWFAKHILQAALFPICLAVSIVTVLWGKFDQVYNAAFYFSGILLLTIALYALALVVIERAMGQKGQSPLSHSIQES